MPIKKETLKKKKKKHGDLKRSNLKVGKLVGIIFSI
jgi:hypothetical protein